MEQVILEEFQQFLNELKDENFIFGKYFDEDDYSDDYCGNDIEEAQGKLFEKIKEYLKENHPGKYLVTAGYCIFVMTPERARLSRMSEQTINNNLVG